MAKIFGVGFPNFTTIRKLESWPSYKMVNLGIMLRIIVQLSCFERLILNIIGSLLEDIIPMEQPGSCSGRSFGEQVFSLTTYIEAGFHKKSVAFIDPKSTYNIVWKDGLIYKFLSVMPFIKIATLLNNMLSDR